MREAINGTNNEARTVLACCHDVCVCALYIATKKRKKERPIWEKPRCFSVNTDTPQP